MSGTDVRSNEPMFDCVWPLGRVRTAAGGLAPRIGDLSGRTIAVVWNYLFRGETLFPELCRLLAARFPGVRFVGHDAFGNTNGPQRNDILARMPETLREHGVDAVISGIGA